MATKSRTEPAANTGYTTTQIVLHWTIAALVFFQLVVNEDMQKAFDDRVDGDRIEDWNGALLHIAVGSTVLILAVVRLFVRWRVGAPPAHQDKAALLIWIGYATHWALYAMIFGMPLTGLAAWVGMSETMGEIHEIGRLVIIPLIGFHVLGALAEHFVFRNDALMRMLRPTARAKN